MNYMGGKCRIRKYILPIILKDRQEGQWYVEPFCGGCNTLSEVTGPRIGADIHYHLINMWEHVSNGWLPPEKISEEQYNSLKGFKNDVAVDDPLIGYTGFTMSFGGKWFGGYARDNNFNRNYDAQAYRAALIQFPKLKDVLFIHKGFDGFCIPSNSIIYCDPPYFGTTRYKDKLNHRDFWLWAVRQVNLGHKVFVSEYNAPEDWVAVWSKDWFTTISQGANKKSTEKLFVHRSQL